MSDPSGNPTKNVAQYLISVTVENLGRTSPPSVWQDAVGESHSLVSEKRKSVVEFKRVTPGFVGLESSFIRNDTATSNDNVFGTVEDSEVEVQIRFKAVFDDIALPKIEGKFTRAAGADLKGRCGRGNRSRGWRRGCRRD